MRGRIDWFMFGLTVGAISGVIIGGEVVKDAHQETGARMALEGKYSLSTNSTVKAVFFEKE